MFLVSEKNSLVLLLVDHIPDSLPTNATLCSLSAMYSLPTYRRVHFFLIRPFVAQF